MSRIYIKGAGGGTIADRLHRRFCYGLYILLD